MLIWSKLNIITTEFLISSGYASIVHSILVFLCLIYSTLYPKEQNLHIICVLIFSSYGHITMLLFGIKLKEGWFPCRNQTSLLTCLIVSLISTHLMLNSKVVLCFFGIYPSNFYGYILSPLFFISDFPPTPHTYFSGETEQSKY